MIISRRDGLRDSLERENPSIWGNCAPIHKTCANTAEDEKEKMQLSNPQIKAKLTAAYREKGRDKRARYALSEIPPAI